MACFEATVQTNWLQNFISGVEMLTIFPSRREFIAIILQLSSFLKITSIRKVLNIWDSNTLSLKRKFRNIECHMISTNLMISNSLTKELPPKTFSDLVENMGIMSTSNDECCYVLINVYLTL